MWSIARRWSPSLRFDTCRSPMMLSSARRRSSARRTRSWSCSISARRSSVFAEGSPLPAAFGIRASTSLVRRAFRPELRDLLLEAFQFLLERDHLQLAADDDLLELLQVEDLLLELRLRLLEVVHDLLVGPHVAEDADRADHLPVWIAERRGVQARRDHLARRRPRVEPRVARDAALDHLAQGSGELPRLLLADEARQRLLDD